MTGQARHTEERLLSVHWWTPTLLSFTISRPADYSFIPGQYSRLGLPDDHGRLIWRAFSMVSAPSQDTLEYYGVIVPKGLFTSRLEKLAVGDSIALDRQVFGYMTAERFTDGENLWLLSTGTGLGPSISMLRDGRVMQQFSRIVVVHGARHASDLSYSGELHAMAAASQGRLVVVQAVSRDSDVAPGVLKGRLTGLLTSGQMEAAAGLSLHPDSSRVLLCGNPDMIEDMRGLLHERGMRPLRRNAPGQFVTENYW